MEIDKLWNTAINAISLNRDLAKQAEEIISGHPSEKYYNAWAALYIFRFCNSDGRYDKQVMKHLQKALNSGLNFQSNTKYYLEVLKVLSQLCFKYNKLQDANNHLLLLRDLSDSADLPKWVANYSAKILYKLDFALAIQYPEVFFGLFPEDEYGKLVFDEQGIAVTKEFLNLSYESFKEKVAFKRYYANFIRVIDKKLQNISAILSDEMLALMSIETKLQSQQSDLKTNPLLIENIGLQKLILQLKSDNQRLISENNNLENQLSALNEKIDLLQEIPSQQIDTSTSPYQNFNTLRKIKILVLGTPKLQPESIYAIGRSFGLEKKQLYPWTDYEKNKRYNIEKLRWNSPYSGILIGPIAHKVIGIGDSTSVSQKLKEEGFPPFEEIRTHSRQLKISKTSFKEALSKLLISIQANEPV